MVRNAQLEDVFTRECGYVLNSLRRLGVREADIDDLAQDVFLAVHRRFAEYDPSRAIRPWLFAFVFRGVANYRRLARHRESSFDPAEAGAVFRVAPDQEESALLAERRATLQRALDTLDLKHRAVLILVDLDGIAPQVAALSLGIPVDTVYSRVRNGRKKLRRAIETDEERELQHAGS